MKKLPEKFTKLITCLNLTLEEVSAGTRKHGSHIRFASLKNLKHGTGGTNPSSTRILALAKTLRVPVRFLSDDTVTTPLDAVIADTSYLSSDEQCKLLAWLQQLQTQTQP